MKIGLDKLSLLQISVAEIRPEEKGGSQRGPPEVNPGKILLLKHSPVEFRTHKQSSRKRVAIHDP